MHSLNLKILYRVSQNYLETYDIVKMVLNEDGNNSLQTMYIELKT